MPSIQYQNKVQIPYRLMDDPYYCGPACAQMMLAYLNDYLIEAGKVPEQKNLLVSLPNHDLWDEQAWNSYTTSPKELVESLNRQLKPDTIEFEYVKEISHSETAFMNTLREALEMSDACPQIAPYQSEGHWVVFYDFQLNPKSTTKGKFTGHDPYYLPAGQANSPTSKTKITVSNNAKNFFYEEGINNKGEKITVRNTLVRIAPKVDRTGARIRPTFPPVDLPVVPANPMPPNAQHIIKELAEYGLLEPERPGVSPSLSRLSAPYLVKWIDHPDRNYYLVSLQGTADLPVANPLRSNLRAANMSRKNILLARFSASTGEFMDALNIPPTEYLLGSSSLSSSLVTSAVDKFPASKRAIWGEAFRQELAKTDRNGAPIPNLVWKPCLQSLSAFYPFYEVKSLTDNSTFYVRIDGTYFPRLTTVIDT